MSNEFIWPIRVYYEDTDTGGVVYYANYLKFFERARTEWLNYLGIDQAKLLTDKICFAVKSVNIEYNLPARLNDQLEVVSQMSDLRGASVTFHQKIFNLGNSGILQRDTAKRDTLKRDNLLCQAIVKVVSLNNQTFTPCRIPAKVKEELGRAC